MNVHCLALHSPSDTLQAAIPRHTSIRACKTILSPVFEHSGWAVLTKAPVDVVEAIQMSFAVLVEEVVHLRTAAGEQQVMRSHFIEHHLEHRTVEVGVDDAAYIKAQ